MINFREYNLKPKKIKFKDSVWIMIYSFHEILCNIKWNSILDKLKFLKFFLHFWEINILFKMLTYIILHLLTISELK